MTEEEFEAKMEYFGDVIEKTVEDAADVLDESLNYAWQFRPVRVAANTLTFITGAGMIVSAELIDKIGYHKTAKAFLIGGGLVIAVKIVELSVFRRRR